MANKKVGIVNHYYDKIGVVTVEATAAIKVGDTIKIVKGEDEFEQTVDSMHIDHKPVKSAKKGDSIGLKVIQPTKPGAEVLLVS